MHSANKWRNIDLQVLPLGHGENSGTDGSFRLLKLRNGSSVAFSESPLNSRVMTDPGRQRSSTSATESSAPKPSAPGIRWSSSRKYWEREGHDH
ncbi:Scr1 family TA system antitoxin-like transcriptional regulator [Streptomyces sp. NPDC088124]|uniref:Scr1 family TA system antitoxin-like transcriptional regulator n=1 Tax=Streptomyces sp. NPDC088124 TaxID=3154654 RepID=UPI00342E58A7